MLKYAINSILALFIGAASFTAAAQSAEFGRHVLDADTNMMLYRDCDITSRGIDPNNPPIVYQTDKQDITAVMKYGINCIMIRIITGNGRVIDQSGVLVFADTSGNTARLEYILKTGQRFLYSANKKTGKFKIQLQGVDGEVNEHSWIKVKAITR
ncbi:hypothetical protein ABL345_004444 [Salmonella enterica subsp. enterica serovar Braenderup]|nr:hypothetical protein [Salmonella enterica]ECZ6006436.1 hypothetical protein [Salmonella enterica]